MQGETDLSRLVKGMTPKLHEGAYVFVTLENLSKVKREDTLGEFKEAEGTTVILEKAKAEELNLSFTFVASWITLMIHSSLEAVGLTALFSTELAKYNISCNTIAGFYHDHIFVDKKDEQKAINVLRDLSKRHSQ